MRPSMFLTHNEVVPSHIADKIAIESEDELHRPTFELYACMGFLGQSAEWDRTEFGESAARGYECGMRIRADEDASAALNAELWDIALTAVRLS